MKKDVYNFERSQGSIWLDEYYSNKKFCQDKLKLQNLTSFNLPYDYNISNNISYNSEKISIDLSKENFKNIEKIAIKMNVLNYSVFLSCLYILLYKYTSKLDIVINDFLNNITLNININPYLKFEEFVNSVNEKIKEKIYFHESHDMIFTYHDDINEYSSKIKLNNTKISFEIEYSLNKLNLEFNKNLFEINTAKSILAHYFFILKQACKNQECKINDFEMITPEEDRLLEKYNNKNNELKKESILSIIDSNDKNIKIYILDENMKYKPIGTIRSNLYYGKIK